MNHLLIHHDCLSLISVFVVSLTLGYIRILLTIAACYLMYSYPLTAALFFTLSHTILDDLDGIAARQLKQGSNKMTELYCCYIQK